MLLKTFKFRASILFAIISFLVVIIAGLLKDVRYLTILWRSLLAFLVAGGLSYLVIFILEFKGIINFDVMEVEEEIAEVEGTEGEDAESETSESDETTDGENEESGEFKSLDADKLQRVAS